MDVLQGFLIDLGMRSLINVSARRVCSKASAKSTRVKQPRVLGIGQKMWNVEVTTAEDARRFSTIDEEMKFSAEIQDAPNHLQGLLLRAMFVVLATAAVETGKSVVLMDALLDVLIRNIQFFITVD